MKYSSPFGSRPTLTYGVTAMTAVGGSWAARWAGLACDGGCCASATEADDVTVRNARTRARVCLVMKVSGTEYGPPTGLRVAPEYNATDDCDLMK